MLVQPTPSRIVDQYIELSRFLVYVFQQLVDGIGIGDISRNCPGLPAHSLDGYYHFVEWLWFATDYKNICTGFGEADTQVSTYAMTAASHQGFQDAVLTAVSWSPSGPASRGRSWRCGGYPRGSVGETRIL